MSEEFNFQNKIDKLSKKYKNKKIVIYGAGEFAHNIFQNNNLSKLNIIAITDKKFETEEQQDFFNLKCVKPNDLKNMDYDVILIADCDYKKSIDILDGQILYGTKNAKKTIRPLISLTFKDIFF